MNDWCTCSKKILCLMYNHTKNRSWKEGEKTVTSLLASNYALAVVVYYCTIYFKHGNSLEILLVYLLNWLVLGDKLVLFLWWTKRVLTTELSILKKESSTSEDFLKKRFLSELLAHLSYLSPFLGGIMYSCGLFRIKILTE